MAETTYATSTNVGNRIGITFSDDPATRPSLTQAIAMCTDADSIINGYMKQSSNITDTYGFLRTVAINLVIKMINNLFALAEPDAYALIEVQLTEQDKELITKAHSIWAADSWEMGVDT